MDRETWWSRLHEKQMDLSFQAGLVMLGAVYAVIGRFDRPGSEVAATPLDRRADPQES